MPVEHPAPVKKALEEPHKMMGTLAKQFEPKSLPGLDHKQLTNYVHVARIILEEKADELGEDAGRYKEAVSAAEAHLAERQAFGERMVHDMLAKLQQPLSAEQIADIEVALPELESHCGTLGGKIEDVRAALQAATQPAPAPREEPAPTAPKGADAFARHVDSLVEALSRPTPGKLMLLKPQYEQLKSINPNHPKLAELGEAVARAETMLEIEKLQVELEKLDLPPKALEHLAAIAEKMQDAQHDEERIRELSRSLLIAVNAKALVGLQKGSVLEADFKKSDTALRLVELIHEANGMDTEHLSGIKNIVEAARRHVTKK